MGEDAHELREEIAQSRDRIGNTLQLLARKTDLKGRASDWAHVKKDVATSRVNRLRPNRPRGSVDLSSMGRAGLSGWRKRAAGRVSRPIASKTRFSEEQVEGMIGAIVIVLAAAQFITLLRRVWSAR